MYRVHYVEQTDKMSQQVRLRMLEEVYPPELLSRCVQQSPKQQQKVRRLRHFTALSVLWFLLAMVLWSRLSQGRVWDKLTHWLQDRVPQAPQEPAGASALSYQRALLGVEPLQWLFEQCSSRSPHRITPFRLQKNAGCWMSLPRPKAPKVSAGFERMDAD